MPYTYDCAIIIKITTPGGRVYIKYWKSTTEQLNNKLYFY